MDYFPPGMTCKNCRAPVSTELCPYCGNVTGLNSAQAYMDCPELECKEANVNFWTVLFPLVFALAFTFAGGALIVVAVRGEIGADSWILWLMSLPFLAVGISSWGSVVRPVINWVLITRRGKYIEGIVCGYLDDDVTLNDRPAQIVKILVDTPNGKRYIKYQLGTADRPYGINQTIGLWVYRDRFMIDKKKEIINW